jgi:hypothetical protein
MPKKFTALTATTTFASTDIFNIITDVAGTPTSKKIAASNALVTHGDSHDHTGGDGGTIAYSSLSGAMTQGGPTYTPTLYNTTNVAASVLNQDFIFMQEGSVVTVSGSVQIDPTSAASTVLGISLPVASNFGTSYDCNGNGTSSGATPQLASITADDVNNRALVNFTAVSTANAYWRVMFTYRII